MEDSAHALLPRIFRDMPDQRMVGKIAHKLHDILVITVCAIISGLEHWAQKSAEVIDKPGIKWHNFYMPSPVV